MSCFYYWIWGYLDPVLRYVKERVTVPVQSTSAGVYMRIQFSRMLCMIFSPWQSRPSWASQRVNTAISRKVNRKMCSQQSRTVIWDIINTLFLTLQLSNLPLVLPLSISKHTSIASRAILPNFFEQQWTQNHPQYTFRDSRVYFFRQPFSKLLYGEKLTWLGGWPYAPKRVIRQGGSSF